jgi:hypothetical protein
MGVAKGLERRLERLVDGLASRLFRGRLHPVELGSMLVREADMALITTPAGPTAPNVFRVTMGGDPVDDEAIDAVAAELSRFVEDAAADRGWRLEGPARVDVAISTGDRPGDVTIETAFERGDLAPWALLQATGVEAVAVRTNRALVGRSSAADVRIASDTVSRTHALIWQESGLAWVADLGSSNGTYVNGSRIEAPAQIVAGDVVTFGSASFTVVEP